MTVNPSEPHATAPYVASPQTPQTAAVGGKAPLSLAAVISLVGGLLLLVIHLGVRTAGPMFVTLDGSTPFETPIFVLGVLGLASIVPILSGIVLGHIGVGATKPGGKRGRGIAGAGLGINYALLGLYFNRLLLVSITAMQQDAWAFFVNNFFWWA